jgi:hypothetical protein
MAIVKFLNLAAFGMVALLFMTVLFGAQPSAVASESSVQLVSRAETENIAAGIYRREFFGSADGRFVAFSSESPSVIEGGTDNNNTHDAFLFDRVTNKTVLISRAVGSATTTANGSSFAGPISADGRWMMFHSSTTNVIAGLNGGHGGNIYLFDRIAGATILVSRVPGSATTRANGESYPIAISADGRWMTFYSSGTNLVSGLNDGNGLADAFLFDRDSGIVTLVSRALGDPTTTPNSVSLPSAISADGRIVLFNTSATNVVSGITDNNFQPDGFMFDRTTGVTTLLARAVGLPATANGFSHARAVSANGQWVLFESAANNVSAGLTENRVGNDVFLFDSVSGSITPVSRTYASATTTVGDSSTSKVISADGRWVLFSSLASELVDGLFEMNSATDVYLFDRITGTMTLISHAVGSETTTANAASLPLAISNDGQRVIFHSLATNLTDAIDRNETWDIFLYDRATGITTLLSQSFVAGVRAANGNSTLGGISPDGQWTLFSSFATDIASGVTDVNGIEDIFLSRVLETTYVDITADFPDPSVQDEAVDVAVSVDASNTRPADGAVTITASSGETCTDGTVPAAGPGNTALFACSMLFHSTGTRELTATFSGSSTHANGVSFTKTHAVIGLPALSISDVTLSEGVEGNVVFEFTISRSHTVNHVELRVDTVDGSGLAGSDYAAIVNHVVDFAAGGPTSATVAVNVFGDTVQEADDTFFMVISDVDGASVVDGTGSGTISNDDSISIAPASLFNAQAGASYDQSFVAANGVPVYAFAITDGSLPAGLSLSNEGLLSGTPTAAGTFGFSITATDGTAIDNGGPFTATRAYLLNVIPGADLQITKDNGRVGLLDGETTVYAIVVANAGPNAVVGATITDELPGTLINGSWMCVPALSTAACPLPAAGNGSLSAMIDLGVNQYLRFDVMADVDGSVGAFVGNTAAVMPPAGVTELDASNDSAIDQDPILPVGLFIDGFEMVPAQVLTVPAAARASTH